MLSNSSSTHGHIASALRYKSKRYGTRSPVSQRRNHRSQKSGTLEVYLIRHGQSVNNAEVDSNQWLPDPPLTSIGTQQADWLANHLKTDNRITQLYTSPLLRALQTTRPIADALGLQPHLWIDIHEHGGVVQEGKPIINQMGLTRVQMAQACPGIFILDGLAEMGWWRTGEGFEPKGELYARCDRVAQSLHNRARSLAPDTPECVALVSHGLFISRLIKTIFGVDNDAYYYLHHNTGITRIDYLDGQPIMRYTNKTPHLTPDYLT